MQRYDAALKILLQAASGSLLRQLTGLHVERWLNVEMPQVQSSRVDLLGMTAEGQLVHIELQSSNDPDMALRMAEYALRICRQFRKFPAQIVLHVGESPMRMSAAWSEANFDFRYALVDIRDLDAADLISSPRIGDNLLAILTQMQDRVVAIRQILERISKLDDHERRDTFDLFLIISGLRRLELTIRGEANKMPILNDIMDHQVIGPAIRQGLQQGLQQGRQEARQEMLKEVIEKRFGLLPASIEERWTKLSLVEREAIFDRVFQASSLGELFPE